jgi:hypothetical protein
VCSNMINHRPTKLEGQAHGEVDSSMALEDMMGLFSPPNDDETHGVVIRGGPIFPASRGG